MSRLFGLVVLFFGLILSAWGQGGARSMYFSPKIWNTFSDTAGLTHRFSDLPLMGIDTLFTQKQLGIQIIQDGNRSILWQDCGFNLYLLEEGKWKNYYQFSNFGYTCGSRLITSEGKITLLGGKGDFNYHMDLLEFFPQFGSWELESVDLQPLNYYTPWSGVTDKGIFSLFGDFFSNREGISEAEPNGFYLNLPEHKWNKIKVSWINQADIPDQSEGIQFSFDLSQYAIARIGEEWYLLDKTSFQLFSLPFTENLPVQLPDFYSIQENLLTWELHAQRKSVDLSHLAQQGKLVATLSVHPQTSEVIPTFRIQNLLIIVGFLAVFSGLAIRFYKTNIKKKIIEAQPEPAPIVLPPIVAIDPLQSLIQKLIGGGPKFYSTEELDIVLEINDRENSDNRRVRRSRLVKNINDYSQSLWGKPLIIRERQPEDKRYFRFRIEIPSEINLSD